MREQSSSNIKNTHKVFRGGETKVMKKSLVSLLVFALVFTMVAPAFAQVNDIGNSYAKEEIEALIEAGIIGGYEDGTFKPANAITRAEFAKILALSLELEENAAAANVFTDVPAWAKGYVGALVEAELTTGLTATTYGSSQNITREQLATFFVRAFGYEEAAEELDLTPSFNDAANVAPYAKANVAFASEIGFINGLPNGNFDPKGNAQRQAVARLAYEFYFNADEYHAAAEELIEANQPAPEVATKVETVSATNLKEVVVTFDGPVDSETATEKTSYSLKSGKVIKLVTLSEDETTATLTLEGTLSNNRTETLSVTGVKSGENTITQNNIEFTAVDNTLPEVESVTSLGTKAVKVVFSEPVQELKQSNFELDGKQYFGKITQSSNYRSVVLTPYSSNALEVGDHELYVTGVKDHANFVSLNSTHEFTVVEDKEAPTVAEITATLEKVTITFSEDVDIDTVKASNVYWKSGDSKKAASSFDQITEAKYEFNFTPANSLPTGVVVIYVEGVKDYSGNEIAKDTKVEVTPVIDQTRPEVKKVEATDARTIEVTFSKTMLDTESSVRNTANYTVLNKDDKVVSVRSANIKSDSNGKVVVINLYTDLSVGSNKLTIKNLKDNTRLQNTMLDYTGTVTLGDKNAPTIDSYVVNENDKRVVVKFDKRMDVESLSNFSNYLVKVDGRLQALSNSIADLSVIQDSTAVSITFVERINNKSVTFRSGVANTVHISELQVLAVKDAAGNFLKEFEDVTDDSNHLDLTVDGTFGLAQYNSSNPGKFAELTDTRTLKVRFNQGVIHADRDAFTNIYGGKDLVSYVEVNGSSVVTVHFNESVGTDGSKLNLVIYGNKLTTVAGNTAASTNFNISSATTIDKVAPTVVKPESGFFATNASTGAITVEFNELVRFSTGNAGLVASDFEVIRVSNNTKLSPETGYTVSLVEDSDNPGTGYSVVITITDAARTADTTYRVNVKGAEYVVDLAGNKIADFNGESTIIYEVE